MTASPLAHPDSTTVETPADTPLSHHAIMALTAPFSRRGYNVDLAASDRGQRRLLFRPVELPAAPGQYPALRSTLCVEQVHRAKVRLTRTLQAGDGAAATLVAEGGDAARLLDAVERLPAARQFHAVAGTRLLRSYRIPPRGAAGATGAADPAPQLIRAEAHFGPIRLQVVAVEDGRAFDVRIEAAGDGRLDLTEDLLAVLGWRWRPLRRMDAGAWRGSVKPAGRPPANTEHLEAMLDAAMPHLVETLGRAPSEFHARHQRARWRAAFQRLLPLLLGGASVVAFIGFALLLPKTPLVHMLLTHVPIVVIVAIALMDKSYRLEVPPSPRPLAQRRWFSETGPASGVSGP